VTSPQPAVVRHKRLLVGYNVPFLSFVPSLSSHIVGFINELSGQLSSQLPISGNMPHGKLLQLPLINSVGNAELCCVNRGPVFLL